jgi:hypothetical protein
VGDEWGYGSAVFERGLVVSRAPQRKGEELQYEERTREERMGIGHVESCSTKHVRLSTT